MYLWLIHVDVQQKSSQYCNHPPIKNKMKFFKNVRGLMEILKNHLLTNTTVITITGKGINEC